MVKDLIIKLITEKGARVGVVGLGYVGLPLVVEFARGGFASVGFEVDQNKAATINAGQSYIGDIDSATVRELDHFGINDLSGHYGRGAVANVRGDRTKA